MSKHRQKRNISLESKQDVQKLQRDIGNGSQDLKNNQRLLRSRKNNQTKVSSKDKDIRGIQTAKYGATLTSNHLISYQETCIRKRQSSLRDNLSDHFITEQNSNNSEEKQKVNQSKISKKAKLTKRQGKDVTEQKLNKKQCKQTNLLNDMKIQDNNIDKLKTKFTPLLLLKKYKAELALKIYHLILQKPASLDLKEKSLHKLIIETIYQQRKYLKQKATKELISDEKKYHEKARKPFIEMFESGFKVIMNIFSQKRIQIAKILIEKERKLVFHPTYMVTSQIFNQLHMLQDSSRILTGHDGISKTVSVCLFWNLVKIIDEYRFQEGAEVSKEMMRVPKLVYWTIEKDFPDPRRLIIDQCPQIMEKYEITDGALYDWKTSIKQFYSKYFPKQSGFKIILAMDQMDQVANIGKMYAKEIEEIVKSKMKIGFPNDQVAFFFNVKKQIQFFTHQFNGILGLCSMNFPQLFLKQVNMSVNKNEANLPIIDINYPKIFYEIQSLLELIDYFIFEMDKRILRKLDVNKISEEDKKQIKNKCLNYLCKELQNKNYFLFTSYDIRWAVGKQEVSPYSFQYPDSTLKEEVFQTFKFLVNQSKEWFQKSLINRLKKKDSFDPKIIKFMHSVYNVLTSKIKKQKLNSNEQENIKIPIEKLSLNSWQINDLIDKRLFKYEEGSDSLELLLPPSLTQQLIKSSVKKEYHADIECLTGQYAIIQTKTIAKSTFIAALNKGSLRFSFDLKNQKNKNSISTYVFDIKQEMYTFQRLKRSLENCQEQSEQIGSQQYDEDEIKNPQKLLSRFKQRIIFMRKNNIKNALLFPSTKAHQQSKQSSVFNPKEIKIHHKLINLVIIENHQNENKISVWIIDVTFSKDSIKPKITNFIKQFLQFADKNVTQLSDVQNNPSVQINYLTFGAKKNLNHQELGKILKNQFVKEITFKTLDDSNVFTVQKLKNSKKCSLKRVGCIDVENDFKFVKHQKSGECIRMCYAFLEKL